MSHRIQYIIALFCSAIVLLSCDREKMPEGIFSTHDVYYLEAEAYGTVLYGDTLLSSDRYIEAPSYVSWEITDIPEWITVSPVRGKGSATINITALENVGKNNRACILRVQSRTKGFEYLSAEIHVEQSRIVLWIKEDDITAGDVIDLGLPSGIKWASYNVGASAPEEFGGFYAWGETEEKSDYSLENYKWGYNTMIKYCSDSIYGTVDNKTVLYPNDDVAHVQWGGDWRMPTLAELNELQEKCTWVWSNLNSVYGYKVTGPNGNSIFLPAAGYRYGTGVISRGTYGYYWLSSLSDYGSGSDYAYAMHFSSSEYYMWSSSPRYEGFTVRPVMGGTKPEQPKEEVDLGLTSGIKWATCNVGAYYPEDYGDYYAWGETETKSNYTWVTYKWCNGSEDSMTNYCTDSRYGTVDNKTVLDPEDDVAHVQWGGSWRMPTRSEQDELREKCTWDWTTLNGINGYKVTGPNGNSIFLPAAGYRGGSRVYLRGVDGYYWSGSLDSGKSYDAYCLNFHYDYYNGMSNRSRCDGCMVRPVSE